MAETLTAATVLSAGGWHPKYARVLLIAEFDDEALVLVDGNGDGAEVESEQWFLTDDGWVPGSSSGIGPFDQRPLWSWGWRGNSGYVVGCGSPGTSVTSEWFGERQAAVANDLGIWVAVFPGHLPPRQNFEPVRDVAAGIRLLLPGERVESSGDRPKVIDL